MPDFADYQIFAELQRGPVTSVFKAMDTRRNQVVLIKLLQADAAAEGYWRQQFLQESRLSTRLVHPNLRRLLRAGLNGDEPYLVLEYVEGPTLSELIAKHRQIPLDLVLYVGRETAKAIAAIHRSKILHRDIKPQNILLSLTGDVKLSDMGLAHEFRSGLALLAGTPAYMSPEQVLGREITEASDLFSFGAVFYQMLTGEAAFASATLPATLHRVANYEPIPILALRPETPPELVELCGKLLAKSAAVRYASAETVVELFIRLERAYELRTTAENLAAFLESPETYPRIVLHPTAMPVVEVITTQQRVRLVNWGITALAGATMFLAGVLFIRGVKEYVERQRAGPVTASSMFAMPQRGGLSAPVAPERSGQLTLEVKPWGNVLLNGHRIATTPLATPLDLAPGTYELVVQHPHLGERQLTIHVVAGEQSRAVVDFNRP